jgi:hypothetical protein
VAEAPAGASSVARVNSVDSGLSVYLSFPQPIQGSNFDASLSGAEYLVRRPSSTGEIAASRLRDNLNWLSSADLGLALISTGDLIRSDGGLR